MFGRLGQGISEGLSSSVPKEIEHRRMKSDLADYERDYKKLDPMQQIARAASVYGATPQVIQSLTEMAKIQNQRNAYGNGQTQPGRPNGQNTLKSSPDLTEAEFQQMRKRAKEQGIFPDQNGQQQQNMPSVGPIQNQQATPNVSREENIQKNLDSVNPLSEQALTRPPWSPQQRNDRINQYINQGFLPEQAQQLQQDDERRDLEEPKAYQARNSEIEESQIKGRAALTRHLETKLQKKGEDLYKDISGDMKVALERGVERDLILNPKASIEHIANDWSNRGLQMAKTKDQLRTLGKTNNWFNNLKNDETYKSLKEYSDIFRRSGNAEEYSKILQSDFRLSPQAAAYIAFPPSKNIQSYIDNHKRTPPLYGHNAKSGLKDRQSHARKAAIEIESMIGPDDSLLSIARNLSQKDAAFDQAAFFDQISEDKIRIGLNDRQKLELAERNPGIVPYWGDVFIMPWGRR